MIRVNMVVEGQTEESFVRDILAPHLGSRGVYVNARSVETGRKKARTFRGGLQEYEKAKRDILTWLKQDTQAWVTTMFDLYALPDGFPGKKEIQTLWNPYEKVEHIETTFAADISNSRFIPYIQLHEFEALLFSDTGKLAQFFIDRGKEIELLQKDIAKFPSPEHIDQGFTTAPSKRIIARIPEFEKLKRVAGPFVVRQIGLPLLRNHCKHFDKWVEVLESLAHRR